MESAGNEIFIEVDSLLESFNRFEQKTMRVLRACQLEDHLSFTLVSKTFGVPQF